MLINFFLFFFISAIVRDSNWTPEKWRKHSVAVPDCEASADGSRFPPGMATQAGKRRIDAVEEAVVRPFGVLLILLQRTGGREIAGLDIAAVLQSVALHGGR